jgi:hypothetical protein
VLGQVCYEEGACLCKLRQTLAARHCGCEHHQPIAGPGQPFDLLEDGGNPEGIIALPGGFPSIDDVGDPVGSVRLVECQNQQHGSDIALLRPDIAAANLDWAVYHKIDDFDTRRVGR